MSVRFGWILMSMSLVISGCGTRVSDPYTEQRAKLVNSTLPDPTSTIASILAQAELDETVLIAGKIYGGDVPAFDSDQARFTIIELPEPGHNHEDPGDCVFCKRKLDNAEMAAVNLVDETGSLITTPADQLLGLQEGATVIVKGKPNRIGDMLVIEATSVRTLDTAAAVELSQKLWKK